MITIRNIDKDAIIIKLASGCEVELAYKGDSISYAVDYDRTFTPNYYYLFDLWVTDNDTTPNGVWRKTKVYGGILKVSRIKLNDEGILTRKGNAVSGRFEPAEHNLAIIPKHKQIWELDLTSKDTFTKSVENALTSIKINRTNKLISF